MALRIIKEHGGSVPFEIVNSLIVVRELSSWLYKKAHLGAVAFG